MTRNRLRRSPSYSPHLVRRTLTCPLCLSRRRPSDDQVWLKIKDKTGVTNSTSFQQLDENKRKEMFLELKDCGASLRQLERLKGIGQLLEQRVQC